MLKFQRISDYDVVSSVFGAPLQDYLNQLDDYLTQNLAFQEKPFGFNLSAARFTDSTFNQFLAIVNKYQPQYLDVSNTKILPQNDNFLRFIKSSTKLTYLNMSNARLSNAQLNLVKQTPRFIWKLKQLNLSCNLIKLENLQFFALDSQIEELSISCCGIADDDLRGLLINPLFLRRLRAFDVSGNPMSGDGLVQVLQIACNLRSVNLHSTEIQDLAPVLGALISASELNLAGLVGDENCGQLVDFVKNAKYLTRLNVSKTTLGDEWREALEKALLQVPGFLLLNAKGVVGGRRKFQLGEKQVVVQ